MLHCVSAYSQLTFPTDVLLDVSCYSGFPLAAGLPFLTSGCCSNDSLSLMPILLFGLGCVFGIRVVVCFVCTFTLVGLMSVATLMQHQ